jgi:hypothetical protein
MRPRISPYKNRKSFFANDKGERVFSHRYREMRDGVNAEPAQDLKDDPEVVSILKELDKLERESRPSLGADAKRKDIAAHDAIAFAAGLLEYVAGWAIDHQKGLAQRTAAELEIRRKRLSMDPSKPVAEPPDEDHREEREGAGQFQLDPVHARRFLANFLRPMPPRLVHPDRKSVV